MCPWSNSTSCPPSSWWTRSSPVSPPGGRLPGFTRIAEVPDGDRLGFVILQKDGIEVMYQSRESVRKDIPALAEDAGRRDQPVHRRGRRRRRRAGGQRRGGRGAPEEDVLWGGRDLVCVSREGTRSFSGSTSLPDLIAGGHAWGTGRREYEQSLFARPRCQPLGFFGRRSGCSSCSASVGAEPRGGSL